ncbi:MAG TPA: Fis family transcriptional regulator [Thermoanaerobaculia bacterium]|nr:Fis family transcriptional regulator [Thermoanaerobaculia bacterium]
MSAAGGRDPAGPGTEAPAAEIFGDAWAAAWCRALGESASYRRAAAGWQGALVFEATPDPAAGVARRRAVFLALEGGACRAGRAATAADRETAPFVLRAPAGVWRLVLAGEMAPVYGLMTGKIELARGTLPRLLPFAQATEEMVATAARLPGRWPDDAV